MTNLVDHALPGSLPPEKSHQVIPHYLQTTYWWAYIHPKAVHLFERQWLVNLILWGNYKRLCSAVLHGNGQNFHGRTLQIACAYGDLTPRLAERIGENGILEVIDVLPIQLNNLVRKLPGGGSIKLHCMDSTALQFPDRQFDQTLLFFLLHEQPLASRRKTLAEALRVTRPGGTLTIVDYARPSRLNPLRYLMAPILALLEPFARDLWYEEVTAWLPPDANITIAQTQRYFGGLYQMLVLEIGHDGQSEIIPQ